MKYYSQDKPEWNINQVFAEILKEDIIEINRSARMGEIRVWLNNLSILFRNIHGHAKVNKGEMESIDALMKKAQHKLKYLPENLGLNLRMTETQKHDLAVTKHLLSEVNLRLYDVMYKAGLVFPINDKDARYSSLEIK